MIRDWRGRYLGVYQRQWEAFCVKSGYTIEGRSSSSGERLVAKHLAKTSNIRVVSMWIPFFVITESRLHICNLWAAAPRKLYMSFCLSESNINNKHLSYLEGYWKRIFCLMFRKETSTATIQGTNAIFHRFLQTSIKKTFSFSGIHCGVCRSNINR